MICIVFDITNKDSFGHTKFWYDRVKEVFGDNENKNVIGCVIGNKIDQEQRRIVNQATAKSFAESINMKYFECSAVIIFRSILIHIKSCLNNLFSFYRKKVQIYLTRSNTWLANM
jgi:GTPase SAR1 family protein